MTWNSHSDKDIHDTYIVGYVTVCECLYVAFPNLALAISEFELCISTQQYEFS